MLGKRGVTSFKPFLYSSWMTLMQIASPLMDLHGSRLVCMPQALETACAKAFFDCDFCFGTTADSGARNFQGQII
jgi:hypothetical protein